MSPDHLDRQGFFGAGVILFISKH